MTRRIDRARAARRTSSRHSSTMAAGRGDARDHRREGQRLTEADLDHDFLEVVDGRVTLVGSNLVGLMAANGLLGTGLRLDDSGKGRLEVKVNGTSIGLDREGRLLVRFENVVPLDDSTGGTASDEGALAAIPDPADTPASADALRDDLVANTLPAIRDALATLAATLNRVLQGDE